MGKKTVKDYAKFKSEVSKLKEPDKFDKVKKDVKELFQNWNAKGEDIFVEIHYDDKTNEITELKSKLKSGKIADFW